MQELDDECLRAQARTTGLGAGSRNCDLRIGRPRGTRAPRARHWIARCGRSRSAGVLRRLECNGAIGAGTCRRRHRAARRRGTGPRRPDIHPRRRRARGLHRRGRASASRFRASGGPASRHRLGARRSYGLSCRIGIRWRGRHDRRAHASCIRSSRLRRFPDRRRLRDRTERRDRMGWPRVSRSPRRAARVLSASRRCAHRATASMLARTHAYAAACCRTRRSAMPPRSAASFT